MFKTILQVAYRNAYLRKSRALLLILMIGLSMGAMVSIEGLYDGMSLHMIDKTKRSDSGEISLYAHKYRLERSIKYRIPDADKKVEALQEITGVTDALYRLEVDGLSQTARKSKPSILLGIDLNDEKKFGKFETFLRDGELHFAKNSAFIGSGLAKKMKVKIGSKVIFTAQDSQNEIKSIALRIKAIIRSSNINLDERALYIPREEAAKFLSVEPQSATQIALRTDELNTLTLQTTLEAKYPNISVYTFAQLYPQLQQMQAMMDVFNAITFVIVMVVVFIGILGVMYVSILDRIREFGILLSIGYAYRYIRYQIMIEALLLGLTGYFLGLIVGLSILSYLTYQGLDLSLFAEGMEAFGMDSIIYASIKSSYFISTFFAIITASILSVLLPLRKIKKLNPIEVIRSAG